MSDETKFPASLAEGSPVAGDPVERAHSSHHFIRYLPEVGRPFLRHVERVEDAKARIRAMQREVYFAQCHLSAAKEAAFVAVADSGLWTAEEIQTARRIAEDACKADRPRGNAVTIESLVLDMLVTGYAGDEACTLRRFIDDNREAMTAGDLCRLLEDMEREGRANFAVHAGHVELCFLHETPPPAAIDDSVSFTAWVAGFDPEPDSDVAARQHLGLIIRAACALVKEESEEAEDAA